VSSVINKVEAKILQEFIDRINTMIPTDHQRLEISFNKDPDKPNQVRYNLKHNGINFINYGNYYDLIDYVYAFFDLALQKDPKQVEELFDQVCKEAISKMSKGEKDDQQNL